MKKMKDESAPTESKPRRKSNRSSDSTTTKSPRTEEVKQLKATKSEETKHVKPMKTDEPRLISEETSKVKAPPAENLDRKVIMLEEEQATSRDSAKDLKEFQETCTNIKSIVTDINELKKQEDSNKNPNLVEKKLDAMVLTTNLKKLNRLAQIRGKKARESTLEVKNKVDGLHLELQNLLYEVMHMKKEIQKCMNFSSKDEEIDLIDVANFYEEAPVEISKPDVTNDNPHQQMLARLDFELNKRKELSAQKNELVDHKKCIEVDINQKTEYLRNLKPRLDQIITASMPVQEHMALPIEAERLLFERAQYLPRPLYVLYVQAKAYKDVCDKVMFVDIEGDLQEAKTDFLADEVESDISDDSGTEQTDAGETDDQRGRNVKKGKEKHRLEEQRTRLLKKHPLSVVIKLTCEGKYELTLKFRYVPALHISTVKIKLNFDDAVETFATSSLLASDVVLRDLLSSDSGKESPNSANKYQLQKLGMDNLSTYLTTVGHPYYWVQWICGLHYLPNEDVNSYVPVSSLSVKHFQSVVKSIRSRLLARLQLQYQLQKLEHLVIPSVQQKTALHMFPMKVVCMLTSWKVLSYEEFQAALPSSRELTDFNIVTEDCTFYTATLTREDALNVIIVLHDNYPKQPPLLLVSMKDGNIVNTQADLQCLEREVNAYTGELLEIDDKNMLLSNMLRRLQVCFDMFVETGPQRATKEKLYTRKTRGRDRNRPYRYHRDGYFVHR